MSEDYKNRLARAEEELEASGISSLNHAPPIFRLARALGLNPRPPHYMGFKRAVFVTGPAFGVAWGLLMWFIQWRAADLPWQAAVLSSVLAGALFGLLMAGYYRWAGKRAGLSSWDDL